MSCLTLLRTSSDTRLQVTNLLRHVGLCFFCFFCSYLIKRVGWNHGAGKMGGAAVSIEKHDSVYASGIRKDFANQVGITIVSSDIVIMRASCLLFVRYSLYVNLGWRFLFLRGRWVYIRIIDITCKKSSPSSFSLHNGEYVCCTPHIHNSRQASPIYSPLHDLNMRQTVEKNLLTNPQIPTRGHNSLRNCSHRHGIDTASLFSLHLIQNPPRQSRDPFPSRSLNLTSRDMPVYLPCGLFFMPHCGRTYAIHKPTCDCEVICIRGMYPDLTVMLCDKTPGSLSTRTYVTSAERARQLRYLLPNLLASIS
jgi:hypothetical protein